MADYLNPSSASSKVRITDRRALMTTVRMVEAVGIAAAVVLCLVAATADGQPNTRQPNGQYSRHYNTLTNQVLGLAHHS
jgi:hypothetical protein